MAVASSEVQRPGKHPVCVTQSSVAISMDRCACSVEASWRSRGMSTLSKVASQESSRLVHAHDGGDGAGGMMTNRQQPSATLNQGPCRVVRAAGVGGGGRKWREGLQCAWTAAICLLCALCSTLPLQAHCIATGQGWAGGTAGRFKLSLVLLFLSLNTHQVAPDVVGCLRVGRGGRHFSADLPIFAQARRLPPIDTCW